MSDLHVYWSTAQWAPEATKKRIHFVRANNHFMIFEEHWRPTVQACLVKQTLDVIVIFCICYGFQNYFTVSKELDRAYKAQHTVLNFVLLLHFTFQ